MDIINSSPQQNPQTHTPPEPVQQPAEPPVIQPVVANKVGRTSKTRSFIRIILILIVAALAAGGVYFWQQGKASELKSQLDAKTAELESLQKADNSTDLPATNNPNPAAATQLTSNISEDLMPGNTDTNRSDGRVIIDALFRDSLKPSAVWVEYGTDPTKLDKATTKVTQELGMGEPGQAFYGVSGIIENNKLVPGTTYYYHTAATVGGKTLYSAIASFVTTK